MTSLSPDFSTSMPRRSMHPIVDQQSALVAKPVMVDGPSAIDEIIATRCEIDLSPGTGAMPATLEGPLILIDLDIGTCGMLHKDALCDYLAWCIRATS